MTRSFLAAPRSPSLCAPARAAVHAPALASTLASMLATVVSVLAVAGCADDAGDGALRIIRNQATEDDTCVISPSLTATGRSRGTIEVSSPVDYLLTPVVQNYATSAGGTLTSQRTAFLEGARIDITFAKTDLFTAAELTELSDAGLTKFASPFSAPVTPDGGTSGMSFSIVPSDLLRRLQPKLATLGSTVLNVRMRVYGSMGGGDVESESFFYPVTVCDHNLVPCVIAQTFTCGAPDITVRPGNPCNPFQDGPVDCCTNGGALVCPGFTGTASTAN